LRASEAWAEKLQDFLESSKGRKHILFAGLGNPIKGDDSVGLYIVTKLRREHGANPVKSIHIAYASSSEHTFSTITNRKKANLDESIILFDAIEANSPPGTIIFANVQESKYGFFATHNLPLKLISDFANNNSNTFVLGIQPANIEVGENLTEPVLISANRVVEFIGKFIESAS
jgi:hydrogenase 3 maturation protease